jgi:hypothetical protein
MGNLYDQLREAQSYKMAEEAIKSEVCFISEALTALHPKIFLKPSDFQVSDLLSAKNSNSMTVFTYTVKKGFANIVKNSLEKCAGDAKFIFSFTQKIYAGSKSGDAKLTEENNLKESIRSVLNELIEHNKNRPILSELTLYIHNLSHIKLLQLDEYVMFGSVNYSASSDITDYSGRKYPTYDELICESDSGGSEVVKLILTYLMKKYPEITPIVIPKEATTTGADYERLVFAIYQQAVKNYKYSEITSNEVQKLTLCDVNLYDDIYNFLAISKDEIDFDHSYDFGLDCYIDNLGGKEIKNKLSSDLLDDIHLMYKSLLDEYKAIESSLDENSYHEFENTKNDYPVDEHGELMTSIEEGLIDKMMDNFDDDLRAKLDEIVWFEEDDKENGNEEF